MGTFAGETLSRKLDRLNLKFFQAGGKLKAFTQERKTAADHEASAHHTVRFITDKGLETAGQVLQATTQAGEKITEDLGLKASYLSDIQEVTRDMSHRREIRELAFRDAKVKLKTKTASFKASSHQGARYALVTTMVTLTELETNYQRTIEPFTSISSQFEIRNGNGTELWKKTNRMGNLRKKFERATATAASAKTPKSLIRFAAESGNLKGSIGAQERFLPQEQRKNLQGNLPIADKIKLRINF